MRGKGMIEFQHIGEINRALLEPTFGPLQTSLVVLTPECKAHILQEHAADFSYLEQHGATIVSSPDIILLDHKNAGTVLLIKQLPDTNLNMVVRLALATDPIGRINSVLTFYRLRNKNLKRLCALQKTLYKSE